MATLSPLSRIPASSCQKTPAPCRRIKLPWPLNTRISRFQKSLANTASVRATLGQKNALRHRKLGDSDLKISEFTLGTYPVPVKQEKQGRTDLYIGSWLKSQSRDKVYFIGVSNEASYGVMEFVHAAKVEGLPKILSIQNNYSLLVRCIFEVDLVEVCPKSYNSLASLFPSIGGGSLTGKYIDTNSEAARKGRFNLFPGYMERYNKSVAQEATKQYLKVARKHGPTPIQLALGFARDRVFVTSSIIGAASVDQLKQDIDAFTETERPLPPEVMADIEKVFRRYRDPTANL